MSDLQESLTDTLTAIRLVCSDETHRLGEVLSDELAVLVTRYYGGEIVPTYGDQGVEHLLTTTL